ncbi:lanthionine synthetase C family protein [Geothrix sp. PMB-07]|uniref:lanthionine synthetase C family protein n=1 Tax=Geothrix sp. PMB-07 TaxID=3068640 RepID=UPI002740CFD2|nr:lanthionine synthetase C family protein [Geothrix sp. PMB-07]WLT33479.1 lanthionine synthetase C family protein [Geothrix sp. PMB-07]
MTVISPQPTKRLTIATSSAQHARILGLVESVAEALWEARDQMGPSLASGLSGAALLLGHLSRRVGFEDMRQRAHDLLALAIDKVEESPTPTLYGGYLGIGWCLEHLNRHVFMETEDDPNADMDDILLEHLASGRWTEEYDLISGLVGWGVYGLERLPRPSGRKILEKVLDRLEAKATPRGPGLAWITPPERLPSWQCEQAPQGYLNLGLAHGIPGVLHLLAAMAAAGIAPKRSGRLLTAGMAWLKTQLQDPDGGAYLAGWCPVEMDRAPQASNRIAWCYGDLGASIALLNTAQLVGNVRWEALALNLARLAASRPIERSGVMDVSLCHGSAGNLHIFNRLHQATGDLAFLAAGQVYLKHVLDSHQPGTGFAGFHHYRPADPATSPSLAQDRHPDPGLLEGAAGVALALLSLLEGADLSWDRFLLISTPSLVPTR